MRRIRLVTIVSAALLLGACEARVGKGDGEAPADSNAVDAAEVSAAGKAEQGEFSINAPGFDLAFDIPEGMTENAEIDSDSGLFYPDAQLSGMHIEAGEGRDAVELRFTSAADPETVAAWYRDPARAGDLSIASARKDGGGFVIEGTQAQDGEPFTVRLGPAEGGGTDGRLVLSDRG